MNIWADLHETLKNEVWHVFVIKQIIVHQVPIFLFLMFMVFTFHLYLIFGITHTTLMTINGNFNREGERKRGIFF